MGKAIVWDSSFHQPPVSRPILKLSPMERSLTSEKSYTMRQGNGVVQEYLKGVTDAVRVALASDNYAPIGDHRASLLMMAIQSANIIYDMLMCFKHPAFESENEWRLVRAIRGDLEPHWIHFRESSGELIPYRPMHIYDTVEGASPSFPVRSVDSAPRLSRAAPDLLSRFSCTILLQSNTPST